MRLSRRNFLKFINSWYLWGIIGIMLFCIFYPFERVIPRYAN